MPKRDSLLTERQASELLLDSIDCLTEKMQRNSISLQGDCDDYDGDLEDCYSDLEDYDSDFDE